MLNLITRIAPLYLCISAFAQGNAIKFQVPLDSAGMPVALPKQEPQKLGVAAGRPLNLAELSAKDTATFDTYSKRLALVQDSIAAMLSGIESAKKRSLSQTPALEPKGEFEKQAEFDVRKAKWEKELDEKIQRDSKPFTDRLAELDRAKKKIEDNQTSLYCTLEIKTNPGAASIYLNKEEIGASPAEYKLALPGYNVIRIQKENYEIWDTTVTLQPAQKLKINVTLQEKSIFSKEGEINLPKILAKDTTTEGYKFRIERVKARIAQVDNEIKIIVAEFGETYPALEPQKPEETLPEFERRQTAWRNEGIKQYTALQKKYETYRSRLFRAYEVLEDYIIWSESQLVSETAPGARITLGSYDVEKEIFEIAVEDTANAKTPFHFVGMVGVPRDTAKIMNRSTEGFMVGLGYINYPFVSRDSSFNLAIKELSLSRKSVPLKVEGVFKPVGRFETMEGYSAWHSHANSLLSGQLKPQNLGLDYALSGSKPKEADAEAGSGLGWRGWTRILTFTAAVACGTLAVIKHSKAKSYKDDADKINAGAPSDPAEYNDWYDKNYPTLEKYKDDYDSNKLQRNIYAGGAGAFAVAGILTFFF